MNATLIVDNVDLIIAIVEDASEDIFPHYEANKETLYKRIEKELQEIQQAIHSSCVVPTMPSSSMITELGDEPTQLQRLVDAIEARIHRVHEVKEKATEALKKEKEEVLEKLQAAQKEKYEMQAMFEEDKATVQKEKDQLLTD